MKTLMKTDAINAFEQAGNELLAEISMLDKNEINMKPSPEEWSAGQIAEHLLKSLKGIERNFALEGAIAIRPADQYDQNLKDIFFDFDKKFKSVDKLLPGNTIDPGQLKSELNDIIGKMRASAEKVPAELLIDKLEFPGIGAMTSVEWLKMCTYHIQRHIAQIKKVKIFVQQNNEVFDR